MDAGFSTLDVEWFEQDNINNLDIDMADIINTLCNQSTSIIAVASHISSQD